MVNMDSLVFAPRHLFLAPSQAGERFPWKTGIVTTVFWIGEEPSGNNPVPNVPPSGAPLTPLNTRTR